MTTGQFAPDFSVKDLTGKEVHLKDLSGKVVLLDFWATGCAPCIQDFPKLKSLYASFSRDDLAIVGISIDRNLEYLAQFIEAKQIPWTQIPDGPTRGNTLVDLYNVNYIPGYLLLIAVASCRKKGFESRFGIKNSAICPKMSYAYIITGLFNMGQRSILFFLSVYFSRSGERRGRM